MYKLVLLAFTLSITTLAVLNALAQEFYLYWIYSWFDIPMHLLGGASVALGYQSRFMLKRIAPRLSFTLLSTIMFVMTIGILWEVYEYAMGAVAISGYAFDTMKDLVDDFIGAVAGYYVAQSLIRMQTFL